MLTQEARRRIIGQLEAVRAGVEVRFDIGAMPSIDEVLMAYLSLLPCAPEIVFEHCDLTIAVAAANALTDRLPLEVS